MLAEDLNNTIIIWTEGLRRYSFNELTARPIPDRWSLGQIYEHLIRESGFFFDQVKICASNNQNAEGKMLSGGLEMFLNNSFPDEILEGPPTNALVTQPESKEYLVTRFADLTNQIEELSKLIATTTFNGKTMHPGLGYFSARDWFQFAEMHLRHHLRQKERVEAALARDSGH